MAKLCTDTVHKLRLGLNQYFYQSRAYTEMENYSFMCKCNVSVQCLLGLLNNSKAGNAEMSKHHEIEY